MTVFSESSTASDAPVSWQKVTTCPFPAFSKLPHVTVIPLLAFAARASEICTSRGVSDAFALMNTATGPDAVTSSFVLQSEPEYPDEHRHRQAPVALLTTAKPFPLHDAAAVHNLYVVVVAEGAK